MDIETAFKYLGVHLKCGNRWMYQSKDGKYTVKELPEGTIINEVIVWKVPLEKALKELIKGTDFITKHSTRPTS